MFLVATSVLYVVVLVVVRDILFGNAEKIYFQPNIYIHFYDLHNNTVIMLDHT